MICVAEEELGLVEEGEAAENEEAGAWIWNLPESPAGSLMYE